MVDVWFYLLATREKDEIHVQSSVSRESSIAVAFTRDLVHRVLISFPAVAQTCLVGLLLPVKLIGAAFQPLAGMAFRKNCPGLETAVSPVWGASPEGWFESHPVKQAHTNQRKC